MMALDLLRETRIMESIFATCEDCSSIVLHVISRKALKDAATQDKSLGRPLSDWYKVAKNASWQSLVDVRKAYASADYVDPFTVFNIKGNAYRLIVKIEYRWQLIFIKHVLTHQQYAEGTWRRSK